MGQYDENLYETRTNLFSSENIVDYLWRRCEKSSKFFKPDNSFGINTKEVEKKYLRGKEMMTSYVLTPKDIKSAMNIILKSWNLKPLIWRKTLSPKVVSLWFTKPTENIIACLKSSLEKMNKMNFI